MSRRERRPNEGDSGAVPRKRTVPPEDQECRAHPPEVHPARDRRQQRQHPLQQQRLQRAALWIGVIGTGWGAVKTGMEKQDFSWGAKVAGKEPPRHRFLRDSRGLWRLSPSTYTRYFKGSEDGKPRAHGKDMKV